MRQAASLSASVLALFLGLACDKEPPAVRVAKAPTESHEHVQAPLLPSADVASAPRFGAERGLSELLPPFVSDEQAAELIYVGGVIVPMTGEDDRAEALAVRHGKISGVGATRAVLASQRGKHTRLVDLDGKTLLPGFFGRGRLARAALMLPMVRVGAPPLGPIASVADLLDVLRNGSEPRPFGSWIVGTGYRAELLNEQRFPTREELDAVSSDRPVLVLHASGRMGVCNSRCLGLVGYGPNSLDPRGGAIRRKEKSRDPNGVLEGTALYAVRDKLPWPSAEEALAALDALQERYAARGVTTLTNEVDDPSGTALVASAASAARLYLDVVSYARIDVPSEQPRATYQNRHRPGGLRVVLDGPVQDKEAWLSEPYVTPGDGEKVGYAGRSIMTDASLLTALERARQDGTQLLAHCHGDRAIEQFLRVAEKVLQGDTSDRRWTMSADFVRREQLEQVKQLSLLTSFFTSQIYYWGDWERNSVLGPERAENVSPARWAIDQELRFTLRDDPLLAPPDPLLTLWSSTNRLTHSDELLGADQRISPYRALEGVTVNAAYQLFEEADKGTLEPGKRADFVILAENPLTAPQTSLRSLEVVETIKDGVRVWPR